MKFISRIDKYFLTEVCPFSNRRHIKGRSVAVASGSILLIFILYVLVAGGDAEKSLQAKARPVTTNAAATASEASAPSAFVENPYIKSYDQRQQARASRSYGASQVVKRSAGAGPGGEKLPTGTTIPARLMNTVLSSDHGSPVIAVIGQDVYFQNALILPAETKAIGQASLDETTKRLQVRFHTFVFPDGEQASVSGLALQPDGSSGIPGDYHSGQLRNQFGRFTGNFVGGMASGLKDRQAGGFGSPLEPGSLKNGLLNGLAESTTDQAKVFADDMKNVHPFLEVPAGAQFLIYLEQSWAKPGP